MPSIDYRQNKILSPYQFILISIKLLLLSYNDNGDDAM